MTGQGRPQTPTTEVETIRRRIVEIWSSVLGGVEVHEDSHLMDLGATSLTAVRIRSRIHAELGRELDIVDLLEHPTPRELAPIVAAAEPWRGAREWQQLDWSAEEEPDEREP